MSCPHLLELMKEEHLSAMKGALPSLVASMSEGVADGVDTVEIEMADGLYFNASDSEWRFDVKSKHQPLSEDSSRLVELKKKRMSSINMPVLAHFGISTFLRST